MDTESETKSSDLIKQIGLQPGAAVTCCPRG